MSAQLQQECAEAISGSLHRLDFEFLGEGPGSTWWARGHELGKRIRVEVQRSALADVVNVNVEYHNLAVPPRVLKGRIVLTVDTAKARPEVESASGAVVHRVLEIFKEVLEGSGVAGSEVVTPQNIRGEQSATPPPPISTSDFSENQD